MLISLALIFIGGLTLGNIFNRLKLPSLVGMIITGIILGPFGFNLLSDKILYIADDLRELALVIILTRAGLSLNIDDLKKVGRSGILMCFVPACFEMAIVIILAPIFFGISIIEAGILAAVLAAVSPAVIVPRMIKIKEEGYGTKKRIPQLILAGASVDDVFVIVIFTAFLGLNSGEAINFYSFLVIPFSIVSGILFGYFFGNILTKYFEKVHIRDTVKVIILLSTSFVFLYLEDLLINIVPFSSLLAIMSVGIIINQKNINLARRLGDKYNRLWIAAEIVLFVLVGSMLDIKYAIAGGSITVLILVVALLFRVLGVFIALIGTNFSLKERIFCMGSYVPKATVQAGIGGIPLALGLPCGELVLTVSILSILITAPLGALFIDLSYKKMLDGIIAKSN
ncbi:MAG: cation:proton antiporter [Lachnospirales bacterium]